MEAAARGAFLEQIGRFSGYIGPLAKTVLDGSAETAYLLMQAWEHQIRDETDLARYYQKIVDTSAGSDAIDSARIWIATLEKWGLLHDNPDEIIVMDSQIARRYLVDRSCPLGSRMKVLRPSWFIVIDGETRIVEQGTGILLDDGEKDVNIEGKIVMRNISESRQKEEMTNGRKIYWR